MKEWWISNMIYYFRVIVVILRVWKEKEDQVRVCPWIALSDLLSLE